MVAMLQLLLVTSVCLLSTARAEVMFEGYSTVRSGEKQIGYVVQRYEFDAGKKKFTSTYYLKTNKEGGDITESLKAQCNDKFQPLNYQYTTKVGETIKTVDAKFKGKTMTATVGDGKTEKKSTSKVEDGVFLSTFVGYLMLQNGYKVGKSFKYRAIAEEDAKIEDGTATIKTEQKLNGQTVYIIANRFKGADFTSLVNAKGEVFKTESPLQNISTELKASKEDATSGFTLPPDTLKTLFGQVPDGKKNSLVAQNSNPATTAVTGKNDVTLKVPPKLSDQPKAKELIQPVGKTPMNASDKSSETTQEPKGQKKVEEPHLPGEGSGG